MVITRSQAGDNVEEERLRLLEEERRLEQQRLMEQTPLRGGPAEGAAEPADPLRTVADNPNLRRVLVDDSPASPPVQDRGEFSRNIGWGARPRDTRDVPSLAPPANTDPEQRYDRGPTQGAQRPAGRERVAFAPRPASVASSDMEVRKRRAELEAAEQIAELRRRELELQEDLIKKRLAATIDQIEVEGSRAGGSVADPANRVGDWLENVQPGRAAPMEHGSRRDSPSPRRAREEVRTPYSSRERSASKSRAIDRLTDHLETMMRPPPKQVYELPIFNGEPSEWLTFMSSFEESTKRYKFSPYENVARLRHALKGEARQAVHHMLASSSSPELIMRILKKNFGRTDLLIDRAIEELKRLPPIGPSATDLNSFAIRIMNIASTLVNLDKRSYGANPLLIREITERLSPHLRSRWCAYAKQHYTAERSELMLMAEFLLDESDAELEFSHSRAPPKKAAPAPSNPRELRRAPIPAGGGAFRRPQPNRTYTTMKVSSCLCCGGAHNTPDCRRIRSMPVGARWDWARQNRVCFKCIDQRHRREQCPATVCGVNGCPHPHHPVLHEPNLQHGYQAPPAQAPPAQAPPEQAPLAPAPRYAAPLASPRAPPTRAQTQRAAACATTEPEPRLYDPERSFAVTNTGPHVVGNVVLLKVIPIIISGPRCAVKTHALLDEGSTVSLVDERLAGAIGATGPEAPLCIQGVGNMVTSQRSQRVLTQVRGVQGGPEHNITLRTVPNLGLRTQRLSRTELTKYEHLAGVSETAFEDGVPYVLIGADHWHVMVPREIRTGRINEPAALRTDLGWVVYGTVPRLIRPDPTETSLHLATHEPTIDNALKRYFEMDSLGVKLIDKKRPLEERAERIFKETVTKVAGSRYEVGQLWRDDDPRMPPTYAMAFQRLKGIEKKMDRDTRFAADYKAQIENLLEKGYAERADENEQNKNREWYLPHFAVTNPNKPGKIRLVFDAAAAVQGHSLNDYLLEGPDLLQPLLGILYRFREGAFAVTADIQEMFLQVKIRKEDQPSQMFLWRGADREGAPRRYKMTSMIFGAASSPFLAHSVRIQNATDNKVRYPMAVEDIIQNHYMDDYVASYDSEREATERAEQVAASHSLANFKLRNWSTNSRLLLQRIPPELRAGTPAQLGGKEQKILGMMWFTDTDELGFNTAMMRVPAEVRTSARGPTKREMLSAVMSVYDPIGVISQYTITAKIQLQRLWRLKLGWDEDLPAEERREFEQWLRALESVAALRVPRWYFATGGSPRHELHVFVDASAQAYAAVAYWRTEHNDTIRVRLIAAKAKVAPTKPISIPRLELQAALIGARLVKSISSQHRTKVSRVVLWSDSRTVLHWVRDDARRYHVYVAHRLGEIAELTTVEQWRWVPTKDNPADDATRADSARQVRIDDRWYTGPSYLRRPEEEWPREPTVSIQNDHEEVRVCHTARLNNAPLPDIARFSNYDRLIGATAQALRFIEIVRTKKRVQLELRHIKGAEHLWFQHAQRRDFAEELRSLAKGEPITRKSRLYGLDPRLAKDGVMRMRGRIDAAPVRTYNKRPVILDGRNQFVRLLILRAHQRSAHANNERLVNDLRQEFWILHLRPTVRAVANACRLCILRRARPQVPALGDLPLARIEPFHRPFTNAAVDYFGPLTVTVGRRHEKRWVALFTCLSTRAVHLELAHSLATGSAIMALRRMAARRGWPRVMYSDNGTNFRGADAELRAAYTEWLPAMRQHGLQRNMEWRFIPPGAPNQGGAWERMVRSVKTALTATLHTRAPKEEVLLTLLAEAEHTVNARPLTHVSVEAADEEALTPNHFLLGGSTGVPLTGPCDEADRRTWRASQALADHFWARWVREYLPTLAPRRSSAAGERQLQVGDYVIIVDPTLPRNVWPRGIVEATYPGPDGGVRSVDVRTKGGVFRRPTTRLAVVPMQPGST